MGYDPRIGHPYGDDGELEPLLLEDWLHAVEQTPTVRLFEGNVLGVPNVKIVIPVAKGSVEVYFPDDQGGF